MLPFPPQRTHDARRLIGGLTESMRRADVALPKPAEMAPDGTKGILVAVPLGAPLTRQGKQVVRQYIRSYARAAGWVVNSVQIEDGYIAFGASAVAAADASRS